MDEQVVLVLDVPTPSFACSMQARATGAKPGCSDL
jgi:hypothetical protein